LKVRIDHIINM